MSPRLMSLRMLRAPVRPTMESSFMIIRNAGSNADKHGPSVPFPPGPRQYEQAKNWYSSAFTYGATAFGLLVYFSDWRVVCNYIPFYNGKFEVEDAAKAKAEEEAAAKKELCEC